VSPYFPSSSNIEAAKRQIDATTDKERGALIGNALNSWEPANSYTQGTPGAIDLVDPLSDGASKESKADESKDERKVLEAALQDALKAGIRSLDDGLKSASQYMSGKDLERFTAEVEDTKGLLDGLSKALSYSKYAIAAGKAANAETDFQRNEALGEGAYELAADLAKKGAAEVIPKLFGPETAAVLLGPAGWVGGVALDVLSPQKISADPQEIIRDNSGQYSLTDKQHALRMMVDQQSKNNWGAAQNQQLLEMTQIVYKQSKATGPGPR